MREEETAVEIRNRAECSGRVIALRARCVQTSKEERQQNGGEELAPVEVRGIESIDQKSPLVIEPSLFLNEREKQQPRENQQRLLLAIVFRFIDVTLTELRRHIANRSAKAHEELPADALPIERAIADLRRRSQIDIIEIEKVQPVDRQRGRRSQIE